ncbi:MAG TPA: hypothetical protein VFQ73_01945 [Flavisolibacter sp.]|nr:hypothetical protein [Flavisolibacter sp.]
MKKNSFLQLAFSALFLLASGFVFAQSGMQTIARVDVPKKQSSNYGMDASSAPNATALLSLNKSFVDATNIQWTTSIEGKNVACFKTSGRTHMAFFTKKGKIESTVSYYSEEQLPKDILYEVKKQYFQKNIHGVIEVNTLGKTAYLITLEDKTSWLTIKVLDGEITQEKLLLKSE